MSCRYFPLWNDSVSENACRMAALERTELDYMDYSRQGNEWQGKKQPI